MPQNRRIVLAKRPVGVPDESCFRLETTELPVPAEGQLLLRTLYLSVDPYMRGRMNDARSYAKPVDLIQVMVGGTLCQVVESRAPGVAAGELVVCNSGWQDYAVARGEASRLTKVDRSIAPLPAWLGVLGMPGHTAYFGLLRLGKPQAGETVVVSAAAGAVGSVVGQIAKIKGCRAVGIAGGPEKCRYVTEELGFDACIDYKAGGLSKQLREACPKGIDVNFENVGGEILDAVLPQMNVFGRIALCGLISGYNDTQPPAGPRNIRAVLTQRLRMQGLIVTDWAVRIPEAIAQLGQWHKEGKLEIREDVREGGVDAFPDVLNLLYTGGNQGKLVLKV